ncbi:MAG TPA: prolyl oligopeptidase family serine peptidase [Chitinophagales bacterium]|nr:prolyl oligopeptidase family serine peptidase [Chitinophagales bacterium]
MNKKLTLSLFFLLSLSTLSYSQTPLTPELLWKLGRVNPEMVTADHQNLIYGVTYYDMAANKGEGNLYSIPLGGGLPKQITKTGGASNVVTTPTGKMGYLYQGQYWESNWDGTKPKQISHTDGDISLLKFSSDGKYLLYAQDVKVATTYHDRYPDLDKANAHEADDLMYRHWNVWEDGNFSHIFYASYYNGVITDAKDIMQGEPYDCPQQPMGGAEDVIWNGAGDGIIYVCKKLSGKEYAVSTNTDLYFYSIATGKTQVLTTELKGYDTQPMMSPKGIFIAWLSQARNGYEADKNNIYIGDLYAGKVWNITKDWNETVESFRWSNDGQKIYFLAVKDGTEQLFEIPLQSDYSLVKTSDIKQITEGVFDINGLVEQVDDAGTSWMIATKADMNHAAEIVRINLGPKEIQQITQINTIAYGAIKMSKIDQVWVKTTDGKQMLTWVIYPPDFNPDTKYPALLYCQGGPQGALSQFYSFRWNFQLMAANGYVIIAPCRRGVPGFGHEWEEAISTDWGGQAIRDYLSAFDSISQWKFIDKNRCGVVGASYGGYSAYMLEGQNNGRFKTFIAHCGVFDLKAMYNSTEEIWFTNFDLGGPWWNSPQPKSYTESDPMNFIDKWNAPIMIVSGEKDYRIPYTQSLEAFQICQLKGIKSRLLVFPDEGHWVSKAQDGLLWQREFYRWLGETLR